MHVSNRFSRATALVAIACLGLTAPTFASAAPPTLDELVGTWQLDSRRYGDATEWENVPDSETKLKIFNPTHFVWLSYGTGTGKVQSIGGGTFTLTGANYVETMDFGNGDINNLRGEKQVFTLELKGDRLEQVGQLSNGMKIDEVWHRVRR